MKLFDRVFPRRLIKKTVPVEVSSLVDSVELESQLKQRLLDPYDLNIRQSTIAGAGNGLFVNGHIQKDSLITLYPGTVYDAFEPALFVSLNNHYILRCYDGLLLDAKPYGLSKLVYKSLFRRVDFYERHYYDIQWLSNKNPVGLGHLINHHTENNCRYQELNIRSPIVLPNVYYATDWTIDLRRTVGIVATRDIENEELFTSYHELVS
ncbi:hypothetical protein EDD86DRAFT_261280 [Gorgonomyces haynaldii]|nr:hypothetical protein EDD86DRAFT_261280 [Gorgonomyces haynaldii]